MVKLSFSCSGERTTRLYRKDWWFIGGWAWGFARSYSLLTVLGSTVRTLLHGKINPKVWQVLSLGDVGFLLFFRVVSGDYGKPRVSINLSYLSSFFLSCLHTWLLISYYITLLSSAFLVDTAPGWCQILAIGSFTYRLCQQNGTCFNHVLGNQRRKILIGVILYRIHHFQSRVHEKKYKSPKIQSMKIRS